MSKKKLPPGYHVGRERKNTPQKRMERQMARDAAARQLRERVEAERQRATAKAIAKTKERQRILAEKTAAYEAIDAGSITEGFDNPKRKFEYNGIPLSGIAIAAALHTHGYAVADKDVNVEVIDISDRQLFEPYSGGTVVSHIKKLDTGQKTVPGDIIYPSMHKSIEVEIAKLTEVMKKVEDSIDREHYRVELSLFPNESNALYNAEAGTNKVYLNVVPRKKRDACEEYLEEIRKRQRSGLAAALSSSIFAPKEES